MFPHTVTIYNVIKNENSICYHKNVVSDVFYHVKKIIAQDGKGEKYTYAYNVIFSNLALGKYVSKNMFEEKKDTYTLKENDIVVLGKYKDIKDLSELQKSDVDYFLIKTISENFYGDIELQNIEVTN